MKTDDDFHHRAEMFMKLLSMVSLVSCWIAATVAIVVAIWMGMMVHSQIDEGVDSSIGDVALLAGIAILAVGFVAFAFLLRRVTLFLSECAVMGIGRMITRGK